MARCLPIAVLALLAPLPAQTTTSRPSAGSRPSPQERRGLADELRNGAPEFRTTVPAHPLDRILVRPTKDSIALSVLAYTDREGHVDYGPEGGPLTQRTPTVAFPAGQPVLITLTGLQPDHGYRYRLRHRTAGAPEFTAEAESGFHTARAAGRPFTFTVQADSHLDQGTEPALYERTLRNALADRPDFHVELGDTFMVDKFRREFRDAQPMYLAQRWYFGLLCHSAPLLFVLGNHDGEIGSRLDGSAASMPVWALGMRKRYFPNPEPDAFFSGNAEPVPHAGRLQDYYAFTWGDCLLVVLDPFWYSRGRNHKDGWTWTLGETQHRWLLTTLAGSTAKLRLVFVHHLVGGLQEAARGGATAAPYFEWGGRDPEGTDAFARRRPGFARPVHDLLVQYGVTAVFHGHDHLYAREELDGIVYQAVPQPGHPGDTTRSAVEYGYPGPVLSSSGHLRIRVLDGRAQVDYVRAFLPERESATRRNGEVAASYVLQPRPTRPDRK